MAHLILLEADPRLREALTEGLRRSGHTVEPVASRVAFDAAFEPTLHAIALVDLGLCEGDSNGEDNGNRFSLVTQLRATGPRLGLIGLTARGTLDDKVAALRRGADHCLSKSIDMGELIAVVDALARRLGLEAAPRWTLSGAPRQLIPPGFAPIPLSEQDYLVLHALIAGDPFVTRADIVQALGQDFMRYDQQRLNSQMRRLRRKVEQACGLRLPVDTIRCVGFRFHAEADIKNAVSRVGA